MVKPNIIIGLVISLLLTGIFLPIALNQLSNPLTYEATEQLTPVVSVENDGYWLNLTISNNTNFRIDIQITAINQTDTFENCSAYNQSVFLSNAFPTATIARNATYRSILINNATTDFRIYVKFTNNASFSSLPNIYLITIQSFESTDTVQSVYAIIPVLGVVALILMFIQKKNKFM